MWFNAHGQRRLDGKKIDWTIYTKYQKDGVSVDGLF